MDMATTLPTRRLAPRLIPLAILIALGALATATSSAWMPLLTSAVKALANRTAAPADEHDHAAHGAATGETGHDEHGHASAHADPNHLDLSPQAQRNIGLSIGPVALQSYQKVITIPGIVAERPGRTSSIVAAPLTGVITHITAVEGEAVTPGQKLFEIRLTHEEIVQAQGEFLKSVVELDVTQREVKRLQELEADGAIAGRLLLERKYEQERQQAVFQAQREALLLHGLSTEQVDAISRYRKLLQGLTVSAPIGEDDTTGAEAPVWQIQELHVTPGQHVDAGDALAVLSDYRVLFIEGKAFEQDASQINAAVANGSPITALIQSSDGEPEQIKGLKIAYTSGRLDSDSRTFHFYVTLPNRVVRDKTDDGHRFIDWQFKPGQRVDLLVPVETWNDRLVLPVDAVAREGAESYVFQASGNSFLRRPVHEEFRDQLSVVVANDGSIFPGDQIALSGAQQMQIAVKNKSGGAIDPHAGHHH